MNTFQNLNHALFAGALAGIATGLSRVDRPIAEWPLTLWLFIAFFLLLRFKIYWDDHKYFATAETQNIHFKIGLIPAVAASLLWILGGYSANQLQEAYFRVGIAITISTLWIVVVAVRKGPYKEQYYWLGTNAVIIILLWATYRRNRPVGDLETWIFLGLALSFALLDLILSDSVPAKS